MPCATIFNYSKPSVSSYWCLQCYYLTTWFTLSSCPCSTLILTLSVQHLAPTICWQYTYLFNTVFCMGVSELTVISRWNNFINSSTVVMYSCFGLYSYRVHSFQNYLSQYFFSWLLSVRSFRMFIIQIDCLVTFLMSLSQKPISPKWYF